jgi:hypothetical protein
MHEVPMRKIRNNIWIIPFLIFFTAACAPLMASYSPTAYQNATSLKVETLALMDKATEPYEQHKADIERLYVELDKAYEYAKGLEANKISTQQWVLLKAKDGKLLGSFFSTWQKLDILSSVYIQKAKANIETRYNEIICLELNKQNETECLPTKETSNE